MTDFDTIRPGDIDNFVFDFTNEIGTDSTAIIADAVWHCVLSPDSIVLDPSPTDRLLGTPINTGTQTTQQVGLMIEGAVYTLTATVSLSDQRVLSASGEVECTLYPVAVVPALNVPQFRVDLPAFSDASTYPNDSIQFWIDIVIADNLFPYERWGPQQLLAQELYVAHEITLEAYSNFTSARGGATIGVGVPGSKSVGGVSISYDNSMGTYPDMGYYAYTLYGRRLYTMMMSAGAGPVQF
jgi:hypothetical protein